LLDLQNRGYSDERNHILDFFLFLLVDTCEKAQNLLFFNHRLIEQRNKPCLKSLLSEKKITKDEKKLNDCRLLFFCQIEIFLFIA